jgi:hypothetical protein
MANTAVKVSASPNHLTYILTGDGTQVGPTVANATILADMVPGPLKDAWSAVLTTQAAMRNQLLGGLSGAATGSEGSCDASVLLLAAVKDVTAEINQPSVDVDTDAVTATKAEINITMSDTTGQIAMLTLRHRASTIR